MVPKKKNIQQLVHSQAGRLEDGRNNTKPLLTHYSTYRTPFIFTTSKCGPISLFSTAWISDIHFLHSTDFLYLRPKFQNHILMIPYHAKSIMVSSVLLQYSESDHPLSNSSMVALCGSLATVTSVRTGIMSL